MSDLIAYLHKALKIPYKIHSFFSKINYAINDVSYTNNNVGYAAHELDYIIYDVGYKINNVRLICIAIFCIEIRVPYVAIQISLTSLIA